MLAGQKSTPRSGRKRPMDKAQQQRIAPTPADHLRVALDIIQTMNDLVMVRARDLNEEAINIPAEQVALHVTTAIQLVKEMGAARNAVA